MVQAALWTQFSEVGSPLDTAWSEHFNELNGREPVAGCDAGVPALQEIDNCHVRVGTEALLISTIVCDEEIKSLLDGSERSASFVTCVPIIKPKTVFQVLELLQAHRSAENVPPSFISCKETFAVFTA
ncbi:hypothetical protein QYM36_001596 [Artemia franciscana]|uniref:Uncharacterized protein n=1 Tax=Artemia franciscana TaxID=6661 RepID=A0AA88I9Q8_ARTSF|nr:hypothetical protein QYM36_001596 [Artemia franciscana]